MRIKKILDRVFYNWHIKVVSFGVAILLLIFYETIRLEDRFISVPLELRLHSDMVPSKEYPAQVRLMLRGDSENVFRVLEEEISAYADLETLDIEGEYRTPVIIERRGNAENSEIEITVEPEYVFVSLEERLRRSVSIQLATSGFLPSGYELEQALLTPSTIQVEGPRNLIEDLQAINTETLDLSGRMGNFTERIRLMYPDSLLHFPGGDVVEIRGTVNEVIALQTFENIQILVRGLRDTLQLTGSLASGVIRVQARQLDIDAVGIGDIQLEADASSIRGSGVFRLAVRPIVPPNFVVLRYDPESISVVVQNQ